MLVTRPTASSRIRRGSSRTSWCFRARHGSRGGDCRRRGRGTSSPCRRSTARRCRARRGGRPRAAERVGPAELVLRAARVIVAQRPGDRVLDRGRRLAVGPVREARLATRGRGAAGARRVEDAEHVSRRVALVALRDQRRRERLLEEPSVRRVVPPMHQRRVGLPLPRGPPSVSNEIAGESKTPFTVRCEARRSVFFLRDSAGSLKPRSSAGRPPSRRA